MNDILYTLGKTIQERRNKLNISQEDLSGIAEIDRSYLSEIENGQKNLSLIKFIQISKALKILPDQLLKNIIDSIHN